MHDSLNIFCFHELLMTTKLIKTKKKTSIFLIKEIIFSRRFAWNLFECPPSFNSILRPSCPSLYPFCESFLNVVWVSLLAHFRIIHHQIAFHYRYSINSLHSQTSVNNTISLTNWNSHFAIVFCSQDRHTNQLD